MATLLRSVRSLRSSGPRVMRSAARNMCTAVEEATEAVGPFSPTLPHNQMFYAMGALVYVFSLKWQYEDRKLAKFIAAHKAETAHEEPAAPAEAPAAAAPEPVAVSPVVAAVTAAPVPPGLSPVEWKVADVASWLDSLELGMHAEAFKKESVNGKMLLALTMEDLQISLGILSPLHRKKLMMEIASLRKAVLNP